MSSCMCDRAFAKQLVAESPVLYAYTQTYTNALKAFMNIMYSMHIKICNFISDILNASKDFKLHEEYIKKEVL